MNNDAAQRIYDCLHVTIENPPEQTKQLRECLVDCAAANHLLHQFTQQLPKPSLQQDYLTDFDLVDYCIRRDPTLLTLYQTCEVFSLHIEPLPTTQTTHQAPLRTGSEDVSRNIENSLERQDFTTTLKLMSDSPWLAHVLKSLAPVHDECIRPMPRDLFLLDFMRLPAYGSGNPHYLSTLQALVDHKPAGKEERFINWVLGRGCGVDFHNQGWYHTMLMNFKSLLQRQVLQAFLYEKQALQDVLYYGYNQDIALNLNNQDGVYGNIYKNLYQGRSVSIVDGVNDLLDLKGLNQRHIKVFSKRVHILLVARQLQQCTSQDIISQIQDIILQAGQIKFEGINKSLGLQVVFEWGALAAQIDKLLAQDTLRMAIEAIVVDASSQEYDSAEYRNKAFDCLLQLFQWVQDQQFIARYLSNFMEKCKSFSVFGTKVKDIGFPLQVRESFIDFLLKVPNYDLERVKQTIHMIHDMQLDGDDKMIALLREVLAHCDESVIVDAFHLVYDELNTITLETDLYCKVVTTYVALQSGEQIIRQGLATLDQLVRLREDELIEQIQSLWGYRLLRNLVVAAKNAEDQQLIFDHLLSLRSFLSKVDNLRDILALLPIEDDVSFMKYIME